MSKQNYVNEIEEVFGQKQTSSEKGYNKAKQKIHQYIYRFNEDDFNYYSALAKVQNKNLKDIIDISLQAYKDSLDKDTVKKAEDLLKLISR